MRLVIAGSRKFNNYEFIKAKLDRILKDNKPELIISGGARGVDKLAERYARENNIPFLEVLPDYDRYHRRYAPIKRNQVMASKGTHLIAFRFRLSNGTSNMIEEAGLTMDEKNIRVIEVDNYFKAA